MIGRGSFHAINTEEAESTRQIQQGADGKELPNPKLEPLNF